MVGRPPLRLCKKGRSPVNSNRLFHNARAIGGLAARGLAVVLAMCGPAAADSTLKVDLWDKNDGSQGMTLSAAEVKVGKVTFEITNSSTNMEHEFLIFKTDMTPEQFPMMDDGARVDEGKLQGFQEFGDIDEGQTKSWETELTPGNYILFCNEEGHFKAGMYAKLTVTP
jgi:uncharacterized cupredoxin-like copper-binding protein